MKVIYKTELVPGIEEIIDLYKNSEYFPIKDESDLARIQKMHDQADIVASAWYMDKLIGLSRALSDFSYCCYLSDLCVRNEYKRRGIGQKLRELTKVKAGKDVS